MIRVAVLCLLLAGCGQLNCAFLGSDTLHDRCENGFTVTVYSVPTWIPPQHGGLY